ncbi:MAG: YidB family protein [Burkholderiaceae bacterium]
MNILNTVLGAIGGGGDNSQLLSTVMGMLNGNENEAGNGIGGLLEQFQQNGMGDAVQSWLGSGSNLPISGEQLASVFGSDKIAEMAQQAGISTDDISGKLADLLPQAVDKLTPDGEVPSGNLDLASLGSMLGGFLGK